MTKTILILGASYAGLGVAHRLMKNTLPGLKDYKVVLVSTTTHHFWNLACVRAIVPGQVPDEKIFADITVGFKDYTPETFEFVLGRATMLDPGSKSVTISTSSGERTQSYDSLVITTGSRYTDAPWKPSLEGYEATKAALHKVQEDVKAAKSILIGGAGPTGVESVAELGFEYGKTKEIFIATAGEEVLQNMVPTHVSAFAEKELKKLNVNILRNSKVISTNRTSSGQTEVVFENGEKKVVDLYISSVGVINNTDFVPPELLNDKKEIKVNAYLRAQTDNNIWAAGDVVDCQPSQIQYGDMQAKALAKNLDLVLKGKEPLAYKSEISNPAMAITLGRSRGTGRLGNIKLPSFMIWFVKGRSLLTERLPPLAAGSV